MIACVDANCLLTEASVLRDKHVSQQWWRVFNNPLFCSLTSDFDFSALSVVGTFVGTTLALHLFEKNLDIIIQAGVQSGGEVLFSC